MTLDSNIQYAYSLEQAIAEVSTAVSHEVHRSKWQLRAMAFLTENVFMTETLRGTMKQMYFRGGNTEKSFNGHPPVG